jgi:hypothetical protein
MVTINFIGKATNKLVGHYGGGTIVDTLEINGIFCLLYFGFSRFNSKLKNEYRIPLFRSILWTIVIILFDYIYYDPYALMTLFADVLSPINGALFSPYNSILHYLDQNSGYSNFIRIFVTSIYGMALVEVLLIKAAIFLVDSYFHVIEKFFQKLNNMVQNFGK